MIPKDPLSPFVTSGIRLGTPALTTRGFKEEETRELAKIIIRALKEGKENAQESLKNRVLELCKKFPVYEF